MEWPSILLWVTCLSLPLIFMLVRHGANKKGAMDKKKLPPGPPALLFIAKFLVPGRSVGHIGQILRGLHASYGPIISISLVQTFVFVADHRLAHSVLIKGGGNFDDRPPPSVITELFFPQTIGTSSYGAYWRLVRRNMHSQALHPSRIRLFASARQRARDAMVASLRGDGDGDAPVTVRPLLTRCLFALVVEMALGVRLGQVALDEMRELSLEIFLALAGFPVFAVFPALTRRILRKRWAWYVALREKQLALLLPLIRAPRGADDPPCYADSLLELRVAEEGDRPLTDAEMVALCTEFIIGAVDTSVSLMEWIMAELVNHPDAQARVYEEVRDKPELSQGDLRGMPYLKAVVLEGLRLHPGSHIILPHSVKSDAEVGGYTVPKGAVINVLIADLGLDETVWKEPREFRPERFLDDGDDNDLDITGSREIKMAPFGAGRRMCPGHMLATLHAEYFVGTLVREFQWLPPAQGQDTVDMTAELASVIVMKDRLRARIIPRSTA